MNWEKDWIKWRGKVVVIDENKSMVRGEAMDWWMDADSPRILIQTVDSPVGRWYHPRNVLPDIFVWPSE
jgi:hypothetical protein